VRFRLVDHDTVIDEHEQQRSYENQLGKYPLPVNVILCYGIQKKSGFGWSRRGKNYFADFVKHFLHEQQHFLPERTGDYLPALSFLPCLTCWHHL